MSSSTELTDTAYDILKVLGKDADFLYDTIETYIKDAQTLVLKKRFYKEESRW